MIKRFLDCLMSSDWFLSKKYLDFFHIHIKYLFVTKKSNLYSSLDPFFHFDSIIDRNQCKGNECIFILKQLSIEDEIH